MPTLHDMASATWLSRNDSAVLGALFDPEASLSSACQSLPSTGSTYDDLTMQQIRDVEQQALRPVHTDSPSPAALQQTIASLDRLVECYPKYAAAYNNRAQARRMTYDIGELYDHHDTLNSVLADLAVAIRLASPKDGLDAVSSDGAKVLAAAFTHRAFLLYSASRLQSPSTTLALVEGMSGMNGEKLEELASRDFAAGGSYGNKLARQMAVKTNPYAKLCGSIVKESMRREMESYNGS